MHLCNMNPDPHIRFYTGVIGAEPGLAATRSPCCVCGQAASSSLQGSQGRSSKQLGRSALIALGSGDLGHDRLRVLFVGLELVGFNIYSLLQHVVRSYGIVALRPRVEMSLFVGASPMSTTLAASQLFGGL